ncbi:sigma factor-like helix-turn-helix DNA-binding protein, partial [Pseudomonas syringae]
SWATLAMKSWEIIAKVYLEFLHTLGLPALVKRAFLMSQVDGLSHGQIAAELDISIATVKRHLNKAALRCYFAL